MADNILNMYHIFTKQCQVLKDNKSGIGGRINIV
nr:MAG TPA: hypothetical protein [Caudoviricetes sp.]